jgi:hypothetical protein
MQPLRDRYYKKRYSSVESQLQNLRYLHRFKRSSAGKIETIIPIQRQRSPSVAAVRSSNVLSPNELLPPTRAASSLHLHPGEFYDQRPRALSANSGKNAARSQPSSPIATKLKLR